MGGPTDDILALIRAGGTPTPAMTCATITTLVELEQYRIGLKLTGRLTDEANHAIAVRGHQLRQKGARG